MHQELDYRWATAETGLLPRLNDLQRNGELQFKNRDIGADREQFFLSCSGIDYLLFIEHISESAWIEPIAPKDMEKLQFFYSLLCCDKSE
ncbi:DUF3630 family protein [Planctobacterium marinum]|uniref:Uncharacterized protein n=1 Tax=Planctobacterium marinum TaxID=1631968 RepID=A0AA48HKJ0_9ALTE|nr:hypothetical protein MACH26_40490 [Planctobacterium marinum]